MTNKVKKIQRLEFTLCHDGISLGELRKQGGLDALPDSARLKVVSHYPGDAREPGYTELRIDWEA